MARLTNSDILSTTDADDINFSDRTGDIDREYARYTLGVEQAEDPMVRGTYHRLAEKLDVQITSWCTRHGLERDL